MRVKLSDLRIEYENIDYLLNQVYDIHKEKLGEGYLDINHFKQLSSTKRLFVAIKDKEVLGYITVSFSTEKEFFKSIKLDLNGEDISVMVLNTCAVKYEKCGVGTALVDFVLSNFSKEYKKIYSPVWKHGEVVNADGLLNKFNFLPLKEIPNFWYADSISQENFCPICNNPCTCSLVVYCKSL